MTSKITMTAISLLAALSGMWSCQKVGGVDHGDINAAIKLSATQVSASSAVISAACAQENVVGCYFVSPFPTSESSMADMDAIDRKAFILNRGTVVVMPVNETAEMLLPNTSYTIAAMGIDKNGVVRTAPYYATFTTGSCSASVSATMSGESAPFTFAYTLTLSENTKNAKYITSYSDEVIAMNDEQLIELIKTSAEAKTTNVSLNESITSETKTSFIIAALPFDDLDRPGQISTARVIIEKESSINVETALTKTEENIYEGIISMKARSSFFLEYNGKQYGFIPYSGNGGVGLVENEFSAVPYYNLTDANVYKFKVEKAVGQLAESGEGDGCGVALWTNMDSDSDVKVTFDLSNPDGTPRYRLEKVNKDTKRVFYEGFDLFVYGGFYQAPVKGTSHPAGASYGAMETIDGTEPGIKNGSAATTNGLTPFTYNCTDSPYAGKEGYPTAAFIKNRGLEGWVLKRISEFPGFAQLGNSQSIHYDTYFITPTMASLTSATDVVLETEAYRFAGDGNIKLAILNAGSFKSAKTTVMAGTKAVAGTYTPGCNNLSANEFTITGDILPKESNGDVNKSILKISIEVEGATAETQFKFYIPEETPSSNGRIQFDYVNVYKK